MLTQGASHLGRRERGGGASVLADPERRLNLVLAAALGALALSSIVRGFLDALTHSQDMQWSPLVVLWKRHLDPYQAYIGSPHSAMFALSQAPNNLNLSMFVLWPLSLFDFNTAKLVWASANVSFLAVIAVLMSRGFGARTPWIVTLLFLASSPTRVAIENGQLSIFCLLFYVSSAFVGRSRPVVAALLSSLGAIKYSFGLPMACALRPTPRVIFAFLALPSIALLIWSAWFHVSVVSAALMPLKVVAIDIGVGDGMGDFLSAVRSAGAPSWAADLMVLAVLLLTAWLQRRFARTDDALLLFAFYATLALGVVYHRLYDFVFLLPVAAVAARSSSPAARLGLALGVAYFWFLFECLIRFGVAAAPSVNGSVLLGMLMIIVLEIRRTTPPGAPVSRRDGRAGSVASGVGAAEAGA